MTTKRTVTARILCALLAAAGAACAAAPPACADEPAPGPSAGSVARLDADRGFRDARFGAALAAFEGMSLLREGEDGWATYSMTGDDPVWGSARLAGISYSFREGLLARVSIEALGADCDRLLSELASHYGGGYGQNEALAERWWVGESVNLQYTAEEHRCRAVFEDKEEIDPTPVEETLPAEAGADPL